MTLNGVTTVSLRYFTYEFGSSGLLGQIMIKWLHLDSYFLRHGVPNNLVFGSI